MKLNLFNFEDNYDDYFMHTNKRFSSTRILAVFAPKTLFQTLKSKGQGS